MAAGSRGRTPPDSTSAPVAPGAHLRAELRRLGLDQVAVSQATGVSRQSVNNIINGRQAISRAMAGKLGRLTGHSSDYWLSESFARTGRPVRSTLAGLLVDHQITRAVHDGLIVITPFNPAHLRAASIDLTLDASAVVDGKTIDLGRGKTFSLKPGSTLQGTTVEYIELPLDFLGRLGGIMRLAAAGLVVSVALQVEPGFKGVVPFALFNAGTKSIALRNGDAAVALEILRLGAGADGAARSPCQT